MAMERSIDVNMFDREDWTMKDGSFVVGIIPCGLDIGLWADCFLYEPLVIGLSWAADVYSSSNKEERTGLLLVLA